MMELPLEMWYTILSYLHFQTFVLRQVCIVWRRLLKRQSCKNFRDLCYLKGLTFYVQYYKLPYTIRNIYTSARKGHLDLLLKLDYPLNDAVVSRLIVNGNKNNIKYLYKEKYLPANSCDYAIYNLNVLLWLKKKGYTIHTETLLNACEHGSLEVVKYILKTEKIQSSWILNYIAGRDLDLLKAIYKGDPSPYNIAFAHAAKAKKWDILYWLKENNFKWDENTAAYAATGGDIEILKWLRKNGCSWSSLTLAYAAEKGHLEILKWAYFEGCPYQPFVFYKAVLGGKIKVCEWLLSKGLPFSSHCYSAAVQKNNIEMIKWLKNVNCAWDILPTSKSLGMAEIKTVKFLHQLNCPWNLADFIYVSDTFRIYKYLYSEGFILNDKAYYGALEETDIRTLNWLQTIINPSEDVLNCARKITHPNIKKWLNSIY